MSQKLEEIKDIKNHISNLNKIIKYLKKEKVKNHPDIYNYWVNNLYHILFDLEEEDIIMYPSTQFYDNNSLMIEIKPYYDDSNKLTKKDLIHCVKDEIEKYECLIGNE